MALSLSFLYEVLWTPLLLHYCGDLDQMYLQSLPLCVPRCTWMCTKAGWTSCCHANFKSYVPFFFHICSFICRTLQTQLLQYWSPNLPKVLTFEFRCAWRLDFVLTWNLLVTIVPYTTHYNTLSRFVWLLSANVLYGAYKHIRNYSTFYISFKQNIKVSR